MMAFVHQLCVGMTNLLVYLLLLAAMSAMTNIPVSGCSPGLGATMQKRAGEFHNFFLYAQVFTLISCIPYLHFPI